MLLAALYDFAQQRDLLADRGFMEAPVRWIIRLKSDGGLVGAGPVDTATDDDKRGRTFRIPSTVRNKNAGGVAEFLVDGITALFGLESDPATVAVWSEAKRQQQRSANNAEKLADFWRQIEEAAQETRFEGLKAVLAFRDSTIGKGASEKTRIPFLRLGLPAKSALSEKTAVTPARIGRKRRQVRKTEDEGKPRWWVRAADGTERQLGNNDKFAFEVDRELLLDHPVLLDWWRGRSARERAAENETARRGLCLVTGRVDEPIAATHNELKNVPGARPGGALLVSAYGDSFQSFGFKQGYNSPVSLEARDGYAAALQYLLDQPNHHLRLSPGAVAVWWAREADIECMSLLDEPIPESVARFLKSPWKGRAEAVENNEFFSVVLAGNEARIAVRHWICEPLRALASNLVRWFSDLQIEAMPPKKIGTRRRKLPEEAPLALRRLARTTTRQDKKRTEKENVHNEVALQLFRAAVEGANPSLALLAPLLRIFKMELVKKKGSDELWSESRFALLRLIVNRNRREGDPMIEPVLTETNDPAYNCGRLLAVLQRLQDAAHNCRLEGPGVAERYYGTASTAPAVVFPVLLRLSRHHLRKLDQSEKGRGAACAIEQGIGNILSRFTGATGSAPAFPASLTLAEQGRFALGFYQQQVHERLRIAEHKRNNV